MGASTLTLTTLKARVASRTKETKSRLEDDDRTAAVRSALAEYSRLKPRWVRGDETTPVSNTKALALPAGHDETMPVPSARVEYPVGEQPPAFLDDDNEVNSVDPVMGFVYLFTEILAGNAYRVWTREQHELDELDSATATTFPAGHDEAVVDLCSSLTCTYLATFYANSAKSNPRGADANDYRQKADEYANRARDYRADYERKLGVGENAKTNPALLGRVKGWTTRGSAPSERLFRDHEI